MRVVKWGNRLAIRLPKSVVDALRLKNGDEIEIQVTGPRSFEIGRAPHQRDLMARLRKYRGCLPVGFKFDRFEAHQRG